MAGEKYLFRVVQKAAIRQGDRYLILKRSPAAKVYPDCWDFSGGKLEHDEKIGDGLIREVKEETSLDIKPVRPVFVFSQKVTDHYAAYIVWDCQVVKGAVHLSDEHTDFKWVTKTEIRSLKTEPFLNAYATQND